MTPAPHSDRGAPVQVAGFAGACRCGRAWHSMASIESSCHRRRQWLRTTHAAEARGQNPLRPAVAAEVLARHFRQRFRRFPARFPGCRCRSTNRPSSGRTSSGPCGPVRGSVPRSPSAGTRLELAISTRGASAWVRNTPTGLPDWISSVSSSPSSRQAFDDLRRSTPSCGPPCRCRRKPPGPRGRSATSGSRLFISMRSGASVSQLLADSFVPIGALIRRGLFIAAISPVARRRLTPILLFRGACNAPSAHSGCLGGAGAQRSPGGHVPRCAA